MRAGFYGGVVIDFPNSNKAKKYFLVLMTGGVCQMPQALGTGADDANQIPYSKKREHLRNVRAGKVQKKSKSWILDKKEKRRKHGTETRADTKYTARKRSGRF